MRNQIVTIVKIIKQDEKHIQEEKQSKDWALKRMERERERETMEKEKKLQ